MSTQSTKTKPVALVTGARTGVGLELTRHLLAEGWDVTTLTRTPLARDVQLDEAAALGRLRSYQADLADFESLRQGIARIVAEEPAIDILFNNAGVNPEAFEASPQGREMCFEVNAVAPYILSRELLPLVARSERRTILNTSSNAIRMIKRFDPATLGRGENYRKLFGAYATSKLALSQWTEAVAGDFLDQGVAIRSADPGSARTPLTAGPGMPWFLKMIARVAFKPPSVAAVKLFDAATDGTSYSAGSYIEKAKARPVPFPHQRDEVHLVIDRIYRHEYLTQ